MLFRSYFLPRDWVGIRQVPNRAPRTCYWEGVLCGERYKAITFATSDDFQRRTEKLLGGMRTPSLVNGGYHEAQTIFARNAEAADRAAQALIAAHCKTPRQFAEAAHSLIVLGVPARKAFMRAAREAEGGEQSFFFSALGYFGDRETIGLLCELVADPKIPDYERKYAVLSLRGHADKRIAPALHTALRQFRYQEAFDHTVQELSRRRYKPAGPDLLTFFRRVPDTDKYAEYRRRDLATALAAVGYQEAAPDLRRWVGKLRKAPPEDRAILKATELALLRLTADWWSPGGPTRLLLVPPAPATLGQKMPLTIHVEHIGDEPFEFFEDGVDSAEGIRLDGKPLKAEEKIKVRAAIGMVRYFYPGEVRTQTYDLSPHVTTAGKHTVQLVAGEARSRPVRFTVRPAPR